MTRPYSPFTVAACGLTVSLLMSACGGGESTGPADTVAPTVVITDSEAGATATAAVTFTFTFSEDVGTSFTAEDVVVSGGTAGALTKMDAMHYTLVVTPTATTAGTISVSVAAAKFKDIALNDNTAGADSQQAYDTRPVPTGTVLVSFDETNPTTSGMGAYGGALPTIDTGPAGGTGKALKIVKPVDPVTWGGTYFTVAAIPFAADRKTITARVFSTRAGAVIRFKVEVPGGSSVEVAGGATGAANTWSTMTWDLGAVDLTKAYTVIAITPDVDLVSSGQTYYVDDITLAPAAAAVPPLTSLSFDETAPSFTEMGAYGGAAPTVEAGPAGGSGSALKIVKPTNPGTTWGGVFFTTAPIGFTSTKKAITARVYSSKAGAVIKFKVEVPGGTSVEVAAAATGAANTWSTVTWDFSAIDLAKSYKIMAITPDADTVTNGQIYYIDDITVATSSGGTAGAMSYIAQPYIEYEQSAYDTSTSKARTGNYTTGYYSKSGLMWWWGGAFKSKIQGGYGVAKADTGAYFGMFIANGGTGWDISAATKYTFSLGTNGECQGRCSALVRLVSVASDTCVADVTVPLSQAALTPFSRNLSDFTVTGCATNTVTAFKQLKVKELHFQMRYADMQFSFTGDTGLPPLFPNGLDMGDSIGFDAPTGAPATALDPVVVGPVFTQLTFDDPAKTYVKTDFNGNTSAIVAGPVTGDGKVLRMSKPADKAAGTTISTLPNLAIERIPFTATAKKLTLRVWAPAAGMKIRMKIEEAGDVTHNCETDAATTVANAWETLTFDFNTRAFNNGDPTQLTSNRCVDTTLLLKTTLNMVSVFPNFGSATTGIFYFDDLKFVP